MFYEPSTRTSCSFVAAMQRLGGIVINSDQVSSSLVKGESLVGKSQLTALYLPLHFSHHFSYSPSLSPTLSLSPPPLTPSPPPSLTHPPSPSPSPPLSHSLSLPPPSLPSSTPPSIPPSIPPPLPILPLSPTLDNLCSLCSVYLSSLNLFLILWSANYFRVSCSLTDPCCINQLFRIFPS